jgi:hypothetical protein
MTWLALLVVTGQVEGSTARVWRGPEGERVEVLALKDAPSALLRATGTGSARDGLVLRGTFQRTGGRFEFVARVDGADWTVLVSRDGAGTLWLPGLPRDGVAMKFDASGQLDAAELWTVHQAQLEGDVLARSERKAWPHLEKKYTTLAQAAAERLTRRCGRPVQVEVRWASITDEVMANVDVWKRCAPLEQAFSCEALGAMPRIVCEQGPKPGPAPNGRFIFMGSP